MFSIFFSFLLACCFLLMAICICFSISEKKYDVIQEQKPQLNFSASFSITPEEIEKENEKVLEKYEKENIKFKEKSKKFEKKAVLYTSIIAVIIFIISFVLSFFMISYERSKKAEAELEAYTAQKITIEDSVNNESLNGLERLELVKQANELNAWLAKERIEMTKWSLFDVYKPIREKYLNSSYIKLEVEN